MEFLSTILVDSRVSKIHANLDLKPFLMRISLGVSNLCAMAGVLGSRGFALESAAARVCREAGGRVSANVRVQDMDLAAPNPLDNRRIEVVVDGLPLFHGAQLAMDTIGQRGRCNPGHSKASQRDHVP